MTHSGLSLKSFMSPSLPPDSRSPTYDSQPSTRLQASSVPPAKPQVPPECISCMNINPGMAWICPGTSSRRSDWRCDFASRGCFCSVVAVRRWVIERDGGDCGKFCSFKADKGAGRHSANTLSKAVYALIIVVRRKELPSTEQRLWECPR